MIWKIERVKLRDVWKHEAFDLTRWLQDNIDVLNEAIDFNISNPEIEQSAGSFKVDIVAEDDSGNPVIIENQLEKSDHDHLGKLITYSEANSAIVFWPFIASSTLRAFNSLLYFFLPILYLHY